MTFLCADNHLPALKKQFIISVSNCSLLNSSSNGILILFLEQKVSHVLFFYTSSCDKHQWIVTELGMCIDIVKIWFWIANGHFVKLRRRYSLSPRDTHIFSFPGDTLNKQQWTFTKFGTCIDIVEI